MTTNQESQLYVGIDGGGSKCRAIIVNDKNEFLGTGVAGPANPLHGFNITTESIVEATRLALADAELVDTKHSDLIAGVGLAGVNLPSLFKKVDTWQHPFKTMHLTTDLTIACLAAHGGEDGAIMIAGTGSCGFASVNGKQTIVGAHGFPQGDKGSGAWMGLEIIRITLLAIDGLAETSALTKAVMTKLDAKKATDVVESMAGKASCHYAKLAPLVMQYANVGDIHGQAIVKDGTDYLDRVAAKLHKCGAQKIALLGGLGYLLTPWLNDKTQSLLTEPNAAPEFGASHFAISHYS